MPGKVRGTGVGCQMTIRTGGTPVSRLTFLVRAVSSPAASAVVDCLKHQSLARRAVASGPPRPVARPMSSLPFVLAFVFFMLYPLARSLVMSFEKMAGGTREARYVGLANYIFLLRDPLFWLACFNTALYAVLLLPIELAASLGLALILNSRAVRFRNFFRFAFFSTYLVGQVFLAVLAYLMLSPRQGLVNRFIGAILPWVGTEMNWRGNPRLAMPAVVLATLWVTVGYAMIYWLAALQAVDPRLYEAAAIDGAGPWMRFRHVTLPGIRPVAIFLILVGTIASL